MNKQTTIVIAALMITSIAFAISVSNVSAAHTPTVEITPTLSKAGPVGFEITVKNTGGDPITSVEVTLPFPVSGWVGALMDDATIDIDGALATLRAGTKIPLGGESLTLKIDTLVTIDQVSKIDISAPFPVIVPAGVTITEVTILGVPVNCILSGQTVELKYDTRVTSDKLAAISLINPQVDLPAESGVILPAGTEITLAVDTPTDLPLGMTSAPVEARITVNVTNATLVEDTTGKVGPIAIVNATLSAGALCSLVEDITVTLSESTMQLSEGTKVVLTITEPTIENEWTIEIGKTEEVTPWKESTVVVGGDDVITVTISETVEVGLPPDYDITVTLGPPASGVLLPKDTKIVIPETSSVTLNAPAGTTLKLSMLMPSGWKAGTDGTNKIVWENTEEDSGEIGPGESWTFSIQVNATGVEDGEYSWIVKTTDADGNVYKPLTTTVDGTPPEIASDDITMEPEKVGAGPATIKVVASEVLSNLDVYYQLDDNPDHISDPTKLIAMESADGITWTGTLTIPGDGLWDENKVDIVVLATETKDMAGNALEGNAEVCIHNPDPNAPPPEARRIDTIPPVLPVDSNLKMAGETPFDNQVNQKSQLITGIAEDNIEKSPKPLEGLTVKISVNDTIMYETKSLALGAFATEIDLNEGPNTIKVWVIDEWGNIGPENEQVVFLDSIKPTISMVSVAGKTYKDDIPVNDTTPTVVLTIKDPGYPDTALGIEYDGITVTLENADGKFGAPLENATPWNNTTGRFENTIPLTMGDFTAGLPDGSYSIVVTATDVLNNSNEATFKFEVDTKAPSAPTVPAGSVLHLTTAVKPYVTREPSVSISGEGELGDTVKIYLDDETTPTGTAEVTTAGMWSAKISLTGGHVTRVSVSETDVAGNEGAKEIWGYAMSDAKAPTVTLATLPETTDKTSVILSGTVDKEDWEDWSDITLTVQVGTGSVGIEIGAEGGYSCSIPLSMGVNTIAVRATDSVGNVSLPATAKVERVFTMDTTAPSVTLNALPEVTDKVSISIKGTVTKDDWESWSDITLTVQVGTGKVQVPIGAGGSYNYSIELAEGPNMIVVQATDAVGNAGDAESDMVERTVTPWGIYAIVLVIFALILAAVAIFAGPKIWKR